MADKRFKIVRKSNNRIEPESGFNIAVASGDVVTFTTDPDVVGLHITFLGESPFGADKMTVPYGTPQSVAVAFDGAARSKKFRFRCDIQVGGQPHSSPGDAGGEMEVIRASQ